MHGPSYDIPRLTRDIAARGWKPVDVIKRIKSVSRGHCYAFLRGETNSPRIAKEFSRVLGKPIDEYLIEPERVA